MSNTSYHFKEGNQAMIQGGEKKVMKKILSVALSTAMAFSMFASVAFGDSANLTSQQKFDVLKEAGIVSGYKDGSAGLEKDMTRAEFAKVVANLMGLEPIKGQASFKDKGYEKYWAAPYIEAVYAAGLMEGKNQTKKIFDYRGKVTVQEMAAVLVRALKLEVPENTNNNASNWAKGYVQAAIDANIIEASANPKANATRAQLMDTAYEIYVSQQKPKVLSYDVKDNGKVVEFKLANDSVVKVELEKALVPNQETEVKFSNGGFDYTEKVTWVVTTATKVESASATNLKEVVVVFDGKVDKDSAENPANYSLRSGKVIDSVALADDEKTATILLKDGSALSNNKTDAITVSNIKAGDKTVSATNLEFSVVDNALPEVTSVKSLGTKSLKVVFSEPVKNVAQSNFTLDGKEFFGKVTVSNNYRTVVLTPFSSTALAVGDHKITVKGVKDYADFVSLASTHDFTVVEDKDAPTIAEATATLESVTITFSEDVDVDTVDVNNIYWKSGSDKIKAVGKKQLADNKFRFDFGVDRSLPTGSVSIFVEGVKDYSGNQIAKDTSVIVTPVIDQTRPEVSNVTAEDARKIKITFSKGINKESAEKVGNYTVKDKDGKAISVKKAGLDSKDPRIVWVDLYTDLSVGGDNTLVIQNIKDNTKLQNTMIDYSGKINLVDKAAPTIDSATVNTDDRRVVIKFNKKLDVESLANHSNYVVKIDNNFATLTPNIAEVTPFQDGSAVSIKFADTLNGKVVRLAKGNGFEGETNISELTIMGIKDTNGNVLREFTENSDKNKIDLTKTTQVGLGDKIELVDRRTVTVKFNAGINSFSGGAFSNGTGPAISSVDVDGTSTVKIHFATDLKTDGSDLDLKINLAQLRTTAGSVAGNISIPVNNKTANFKDSVKPVVVNPDTAYPSGSEKDTFVITFSEELLPNDLAASDFTVIRNSDNKTLSAREKEFSAEVVGDNNNQVKITLHDAASRIDNTTYRVIVENAKSVADVNGNVIADFKGKSVEISEGAKGVEEAEKAALEKATKAVEAAEKSLLQADVDTAKELVKVLPANATKTALEVRLNVTVAEIAVVEAENSKLEVDVEAAKTLVNALPADHAKKAELTARLAAVSAPVISEVSIKSNNADPKKATQGDTVTLTFKSDQPVTKLSTFKINGSNPDSFTVVGDTYVVTHKVDEGDQVGAFTFQINVENAKGVYSKTVENTNDGSSVTIY